MVLPKFEIIPYEERVQFLRQFISHEKLGLEIGASHAPIASRKEGYNTLIVDAVSAEELRNKYKDIKINTENIEHVNYIWQGESLSDLIKEKGNFDYIVASHVIEHIPNFIDFFQQSHALLNSQGKLILAIPDKRKCFDYFRPISSTGHILQAFHEKKQSHAIAAIFDNHANHANYKGYGSWFSSTNTADVITLQSNVKAAYQKVLHTLSHHEYDDVHGWVFTPASFLLIIHDLTELGLINLSLDSFYQSTGHEFYAIFKQNNEGNINLIRQWDRKQLQNLITQNL
ncbi:MAG: methyltransferase domain-containing protein [Methylococcales bacterium]|nr:methyltransferase domain-containing protein [Methylococcales bacterium]